MPTSAKAQQSPARNVDTSERDRSDQQMEQRLVLVECAALEADRDRHTDAAILPALRQSDAKMNRIASTRNA